MRRKVSTSQNGAPVRFQKKLFWTFDIQISVDGTYYFICNITSPLYVMSITQSSVALHGQYRHEIYFLQNSSSGREIMIKISLHSRKSNEV